MAKEKVKAKVDPKELVEHTLVKNKHTAMNGGQKKTVFGGPRVKEARKVYRKVMKAFRNVVFALTHQKRVQAMISSWTEAEARTKKGKGKEGAYPQHGHSATETPSEEGHGRAWESDDWYSSLTDDSTSSATGWSCSRV